MVDLIGRLGNQENTFQLMSLSLFLHYLPVVQDSIPHFLLDQNTKAAKKMKLFRKNKDKKKIENKCYKP